MGKSTVIIIAFAAVVNFAYSETTGPTDCSTAMEEGLGWFATFNNVTYGIEPLSGKNTSTFCYTFSAGPVADTGSNLSCSRSTENATDAKVKVAGKLDTCVKNGQKTSEVWSNVGENGEVKFTDSKFVEGDFWTHTIEGSNGTLVLCAILNDFWERKDDAFHFTMFDDLHFANGNLPGPDCLDHLRLIESEKSEPKLIESEEMSELGNDKLVNATAATQENVEDAANTTTDILDGAMQVVNSTTEMQNGAVQEVSLTVVTEENAVQMVNSTAVPEDSAVQMVNSTAETEENDEQVSISAYSESEKQSVDDTTVIEAKDEINVVDVVENADQSGNTVEVVVGDSEPAQNDDLLLSSLPETKDDIDIIKVTTTSVFDGSLGFRDGDVMASAAYDADMRNSGENMAAEIHTAESNESQSKAFIIGGSLGGAAGVAAIVVGVYFLRRKRLDGSSLEQLA